MATGGFHAKFAINYTVMDNTAEKRPMVSVVMITYNQAGEIATAIKGVVRQRADFDIELIISDDASTDATYSIAEEWQRRYPHIIRLHRNPVNIGLQANYVKAFGLCRGRYMALCDGDDYWICRRKLARQVHYMEQHPECAVTFHRMVNFYEGDRTMSLSNGGQRALTDIRDLSRANFITNASVLYRKDAVDLTNLPSWITDIRLLDYAMHMLYAANGTIRYFRRPMGVYRISGAGGTWSRAERYTQLGMALKVREHLMEHFADRPEITEGLRNTSANILLHMAAAAEGDPERENYVRSRLKHYPGYSDDRAVNVAVARIAATRPRRKPLLSRLRAAISRILPLPHP